MFRLHGISAKLNMIMLLVSLLALAVAAFAIVMIQRLAATNEQILYQYGPLSRCAEQALLSLSQGTVHLHQTRMIRDPDAVAAAHENLTLNGVEGRVEVALADGPPEARDEPGFDIVVANIYAETLAAMRDRLIAALKPQGRLVLSGIEATRRSVIEEAFIVDGWTTEHLIAEGNWLTFCLCRDFGNEPVERKTD